MFGIDEQSEISWRSWWSEEFETPTQVEKEPNTEMLLSSQQIALLPAADFTMHLPSK